jgi:TolA-binding protein
LVPTALLRKALALQTQGKLNLAKESFSEIVKSYPYSTEAKTAQDRLRSLLPDNKQ